MTGPVCHSCGGRIPRGARFCPACGAPLVAPELRAERKVISAVFVDLVGYTELAERLDPEQVAARLAPFWQLVHGELAARGGTIEKYVGDAVLALFGTPAVHEDDPERAVRAALAIRDWARREPGFDVRIGVATGEALVRLDVRALAGEGVAVGDVVNTAARLQQAAPVDGVLVDGRTREAAASAVAFREAAPVVAKGKARPVEAWEAVEPRAAPVASPSAVFVGRETELVLLDAAFRRAVDQRTAQLVTVVGAPGIGKTRLVGEWRRRLSAVKPVTWLAGSARPCDDGDGPFGALAESLKRHAGILDSDDDAGAEAKLERLLRTLFDDERALRGVLPHARALACCAAPEAAVRDTRVESFAAWRRLLEALAARAPLVLALDDLQWADASLFAFVDHLVEWAVATQLLVLCSARPELLELRPDWGAGKPNALTMSVGPLTDGETARLLAALLRRDDVEPELRARVGGNPLYAEQFARMLAERGDATALPHSVQAVIGARIDALAPDEKRLLEDAAVVGEVFWPAAFGAADAHDALHGLERKEMIVRRRESAVADAEEYEFRHVLVCEVAYGRIPRTERIGKHRRVAEWLAPLAEPDRLAHHWSRALDGARWAGAPTEELEASTRAALRSAGERALALNAFGAAAGHLRAALELWPVGDPERGELLLRLGHALWAADGSGERELLEASEALHAAGDREREAEAEAVLCELSWYRGDLPASWRHLDAAAGLVEKGPPSPTKAYVLARLSRQLMLGASYERAIAVGREAFALAERFGLDELRSSTLNSIGSARARTGDVDGIQDVERAVEISLAATSRAAVVAYNNLASLHGDLGDLRTARAYLDRARTLAEQLGDRSYLSWSARELVVQALQRGDWDEVERGARALRGEPHYLDPLVRCVHALVLQARDEPGAAAEIERGEEAARVVGDPQILLACLADCALYALLDGRCEDADAYADEVAELATAASYLPAGASYPLAVVRAACGRGDDLLALLDGFRRRSRWFDAARAYASGDLGRAAELYGEIGDVAAQAYAWTQAGDPRGAAFYEAVGARAPVAV